MLSDIPILLQKGQGADYALNDCILTCLKMLKLWKDPSYSVSIDALFRSLNLPKRTSVPGLNHALIVANTMKLPLRHSNKLTVSVIRNRLREQRPIMALVYSGAYERPYPDACAHAILLVGVEGHTFLANDPMCGRLGIDAFALDASMNHEGTRLQKNGVPFQGLEWYG